MKKTLRTLAPVLLCVSCLSTSVWAQSAASAPAAASAPKTHAMHRKAKTTDFVTQRLNTLHSQLAITDAQSAQWDAFASAIRDGAKKTQAAYEDRDQKITSMNADEAMQSYAANTQLHADNTKALSTAFTALYASFSDEQKKTADVLFRQEGEQRQARAHMRAREHARPRTAPATSGASAAAAPQAASQ